MSQTYVVLGKDQGRSGPFSIGHVKRFMSDKKVFQNGHVVPDISKTKLVVLDELMKKGLTKVSSESKRERKKKRQEGLLFDLPSKG